MVPRAVWIVITPFVMNTAGWLLTESGRQPWIVQGLMKTANAASPSVTSTDIWITLVGFLVLYLALGVAEAYLMIRFARKDLEPDPPTRPDEVGGGGDGSLGERTVDDMALVY